LVNFCHTLSTPLVAGREKKIVKIKENEMNEIFVIEGIAVHGDCGGEEIKNIFLSVVCVGFDY
jgi:hypothetical protein